MSLPSYKKPVTPDGGGEPVGPSYRGFDPRSQVSPDQSSRIPDWTYLIGTKTTRTLYLRPIPCLKKKQWHFLQLTSVDGNGFQQACRFFTILLIPGSFVIASFFYLFKSSVALPSSVAVPECFSRIRTFPARIPDSGSKRHRIRIVTRTLSIFTKLLEYDPGCLLRIPGSRIQIFFN